MGNAKSSSSNTGSDDNQEEERRKTSDLVAAGATVVAGIATAAALVAGARRVLSLSGSEEESSVPCRNQSRSSPLQFREQQLRFGESMESSEKVPVYHQFRGSTDHQEEGNGKKPWSPPPYGWYKINTDCSILLQGSGIGYIIRDHLGDMVHAEATAPLVPTSDSGSAEAEAVEHGLRKAKELGFRKVWLETDHEPTVMMVNGMAKTRTKNRDRSRAHCHDGQRDGEDEDEEQRPHRSNHRASFLVRLHGVPAHRPGGEPVRGPPGPRGRESEALVVILCWPAMSAEFESTVEGRQGRSWSCLSTICILNLCHDQLRVF